MSRIIEFPAQTGGIVLIEIDDEIAGPTLAAAGPGEIAGKARVTFEQAADTIREIASKILAQLADLGPETVTLELGIKFSAEFGAILAKAASEGNCKITVKWKKNLKTVNA
jgi:Trypsin-co-occurring domain 1